MLTQFTHTHARFFPQNSFIFISTSVIVVFLFNADSIPCMHYMSSSRHRLLRHLSARVYFWAPFSLCPLSFLDLFLVFVTRAVKPVPLLAVPRKPDLLIRHAYYKSVTYSKSSRAFFYHIFYYTCCQLLSHDYFQRFFIILEENDFPAPYPTLLVDDRAKM